MKTPDRRLQALEPFICAAYLDGLSFERMAGILESLGAPWHHETLRRILKRHGYGKEDLNANNIDFWQSKFAALLDAIPATGRQHRSAGVRGGRVLDVDGDRQP